MLSRSFMSNATSAVTGAAATVGTAFAAAWAEARFAAGGQSQIAKVPTTLLAGAGLHLAGLLTGGEYEIAHDVANGLLAVYAAKEGAARGAVARVEASVKGASSSVQGILPAGMSENYSGFDPNLGLTPQELAAMGVGV